MRDNILNCNLENGSNHIEVKARFVPGLVASTFSFVDKMISSLAQTVVGLVLAFIGFREVFPDIDTPYSESIFWATLFLYKGVALIAWTISLIAMKFYPLNQDRMFEIQEELHERRKESEKIG